jgi:NAD(P)H dehydrogenase (quinone)
MGVSGRVGGAVGRALLQAGHAMRAIVRSADKGQVWSDRGCEVAVADLDSPRSLAAAFRDTDGAFVMLPPLFDPAPGFPEARAFISSLRAAIDAGRSGRIVALSTIGADIDRPNLLSQLRLLELALADLSVPTAFIRPAWFMENAAADVMSAKDRGVIDSYLQPLDRAFPMVSAEDVGHLAANVLLEKWNGLRVVELESSTRVTPLALADAFSRALGRPVRAEPVPREDWEGIFHKQGMKNPSPRIQMIDGFNEGWLDFSDRGARALKGQVTLAEVIDALVTQAKV